jgi:hypothetical protein
MFTKHSLLVGVLLVAVFVPLASAQLEPEAFNGRPEFSEGSDFGYYIWRDGKTWHVRWTTMGNMRRFHGSVTAEDGKLTSLKRVDVESESRIIRSGRPPRVVVGPRGHAHVRGGQAPVVATREQDKIEKDGDNRIVFNARTDDVDGFDFEPGERVSSLRFVLEIEGKSYARNVEVGRNNRKAPKLPLVVRLN